MSEASKNALNFNLSAWRFVPICNHSMAEPYFKNAPTNVVFIGGDPVALREVKAVEFSVLGDQRLADLLNDSLIKSKSGVLGLPVKEEVLNFG